MASTLPFMCPFGFAGVLWSSACPPWNQRHSYGGGRPLWVSHPCNWGLARPDVPSRSLQLLYHCRLSPYPVLALVAGLQCRLMTSQTSFPSAVPTACSQTVKVVPGAAPVAGKFPLSLALPRPLAVAFGAVWLPLCPQHRGFQPLSLSLCDSVVHC